MILPETSQSSTMSWAILLSNFTKQCRHTTNHLCSYISSSFALPRWLKSSLILRIDCGFCSWRLDLRMSYIVLYAHWYFRTRSGNLCTIGEDIFNIQDTNIPHATCCITAGKTSFLHTYTRNRGQGEGEGGDVGDWRLEREPSSPLSRLLLLPSTHLFRQQHNL
jgi:hypothetical protein